MNPRTTAWLLVATLALGAFVVFYEIGGEPARRAAEAARGRVFPDVRADAVTGLWIQRPGEPGTRATRDESGSGWRLVEPISAPAESASIGAMARALAEMPSEGRIEDPAPLGVYGLDDAAILLSFTAGARSYGLRIGNETPVGPNVYVGVVDGSAADDEVVVRMAPSKFVAVFDRSADDLRDRRVLGFEPGAVRRIEVAGLAFTATLERGAEGWAIVAPAKLPADERAVERLLSDLSQLRADSFVDDPSPEFRSALARADLSVVLAGDGWSQQLRLAADPERDDVRLAAGRDGRHYRVRAALVAHLPDRLSVLRSKQVSRFEPGDARVLEVHFPTAERVRVVRSAADAAWTDDRGRVGTEALTALIAGLARLDAIDVFAEALGEDELGALGVAPGLVLRVDGEAGRLAEVHLGPPDDAGVLAKAQSRDAIFRLAPGLGDALPRSVADFDRDFLEHAAETGSAAP